MAFYTDTIDAPKRSSLFATVLTGISGFAERITASQNRSATVQRLQALSDRELADIGIAREDIIRHVYRDIYYL